MFAVQFDDPDTVRKIVDRCLQKGVITFWFLSCPDSFRLAPPLTISINEIKEACSIIMGSHRKNIEAQLVYKMA